LRSGSCSGNTHARRASCVVELRQQLLEGQRTPVLIQPEMGVRVDHFGLSGAQAPNLLEEWRQGLA
jgi:hypothetical protein